MPNSDCPLCHRGYSQLSQHLGVSHGVRNKAERKLLLAIPSRRVDVRKGTCPLPACGKYTSRMDRHLATHTEIMVAARRQATETLKRKKILEGLTQLRASNPAVAMVSTLDLAGDLEDPIVADAAEEQESACNNPSCQDEWEDLRRPVDMLSESLRKVTRRYRLLLRRSRGKPSSQLARVTGRLLSSLRLLAPGEAEEEEDQPLALPLEEADRQDPGPEAPAPQPPQCFYFSLSLRLPLSLSLHGSPSYAARLSLFPQISTHKTNQAFGAAQLALSGEEYGWLTDFLDMRPYLVGGETAHYFFFTSKPSSCKNLNQYFQEAWAGMGLPGSPTFMDIRTSIATHAKSSHTPGDRQKVAQFMCHDTSMADRFYALNLDAKQAAEHCRLFEAAVEGEDAAPGSPKAWKKTGKRAWKSSGKRPAPAGSPPTSSSPSPPGSPSRLHRPRGAKSALRGRGDSLGLTSPP